ncbi:MAG TPA: ABC transporter ATP-binding protein [Gemmataceae bacterium]|nr:ABC transporter ATP-binding protein [Gemmataceae bacterium]
MLRLDNIRKSYAGRGRVVEALRPTTLDMAAGEFVAVVGPSGSGKTTLLSIVGGMLAPDDGKVWLEGQSLYDLQLRERTRLRRERIGFVFQSFNLVSYLSAVENVQLPLYLAGVAPRTQRQRAVHLLERLGLGDRLGHRPVHLSVGQQQRVALARTLANDPALILADEPTGNLDPDMRGQVLDLLGEFQREGRTIVMVTHDPAAAARADRILRLVDGIIGAFDSGAKPAPAA